MTFALLSAGADLTHIEAVDVSPQMPHQARQALTPVLGHCTLPLVHAAADAYEPLATLPGEPDRGPDLITCCRSYHWMNGEAVLEMADRVATPGAAADACGYRRPAAERQERHHARKVKRGPVAAWDLVPRPLASVSVLWAAGRERGIVKHCPLAHAILPVGCLKMMSSRDLVGPFTVV